MSRLLDDLVQDLRFTVRLLRRQPGLVAAAVLALALGVGANAATFSLVDYLLFRPRAHVIEPGRLVRVNGVRNYANFLNMRDQSRSLDVAAHASRTFSLGRGETAVAAEGAFVTHNYFDLLGASPILGRWFTPSEETPASLSPVVVLSHRIWRQRFGASQAILGEAVTINNAAHTVVGVAPPGFTGVYINPVDLWLPFGPHPALVNAASFLRPGGGWHETVGRARDGFTLEAAAGEISTIAFDTAGQFGAPTASLQPFEEARLPRANAQDQRVAVWLTGAAALVLLIACANVAGLLLVRAVERRHEIAVRMQLGAGRVRLLRQLLVECLVLATIAGLAALLVTVWMAPIVRGFFVVESAAGDFLDRRVLAFTVAVAVAASVLSGVAPGLHALGASPLRSENRTTTGRRSFIRQGLLVAQVSLTLVLLIGAALFVRSLRQVERLDFGFDPARVVMIQADLTQAGYSQPDANALFERLRDRALAVPGVEFAALDISTPFGGGIGGGFLPPEESGIKSLPFLHAVSTGYFSVLGTRIVQGRSFTEADTSGAPGAVVLSERTARMYWPGQNPIGQCLRTLKGGECFDVVGVAADTRWRITTSDGVPEVFVALEQTDRVLPIAPIRTLVVRTAVGRRTIGDLQAALRSVDANLPYLRISTLWSQLDSQTRSWRLGVSAFGMFAALAIALAGIGVYGVLAFSARRRTREVGIRIALGAGKTDILALIVREGVVILTLGCAAGLGAVFVLRRYLESLLFGVTALDAVSLVSATIFVSVVAMVATLIPAFRSAGTDPAAALRQD